MVPQVPEFPSVLFAYMEGLEAHDLDLIASTFAADVRFVTPVTTMGRDEILGFLAALYRGFPDWAYDHDEPVRLSAGRYGVQWRQGGTHSHHLEFPGFECVPATGKAVRIPEHFFYYRIRNGKLFEIRPDPVPGGAPRGIFEQIGVGLPPL